MLRICLKRNDLMSKLLTQNNIFSNDGYPVIPEKIENNSVNNTIISMYILVLPVWPGVLVPESNNMTEFMNNNPELVAVLT